jgi:DNA-binding protein H-NS
MNSYNDNLHYGVVASLKTQELEQKNMKSRLEASMFTLYYAEGARITAGEKLDTANNKYTFQQSILEEAVNNCNISGNLLTSATQQKKYTAQSATNIAVSAANIQAAANAVVRLASDIGSVYSIVNAADFDSDIYDLSKQAYELMNETAYDAESVSQRAMEASMLTAEVTSSTVADEAKATNGLVTSLLNVATSDFNAISAVVATCNAALASASVSEKKSEGVLEIINAEYFAAKTAYALNNQELNLNLTVPEGLRTIDTYSVLFDYYKSPFNYDQTKGRVNSTNSTPKGYPVKSYYIMLVKDSRKRRFSISNAEGLLNNSDQYVEVPNAPTVLGQTAVQQKIYLSQLQDSDGDEMSLGQKYVVFVLAVFTEGFKKGINNFNDYLSAPSAVFTLTNQLATPQPDKITVIEEKAKQKLEFTLEENKDFEVTYRCILLPDNLDLIKGLLSEKGLRTIEKEVEKLEQIAAKYDPQIAAFEAKIISLESEAYAIEEQLQVAKDKAAATASTVTPPTTDATGTTSVPDAKDKTTSEVVKIQGQLKIVQGEITKAKSSLKTNVEAQKQAMKAINPAKELKPGFFFNLKLAEQVDAANYTIAKVTITKATDPNKQTVSVAGQMVIHENTTDNFGNPLIDKKSYIPVILSVPGAHIPEENWNQFSNSLSDYSTTNSFKYHAQKQAVSTLLEV